MRGAAGLAFAAVVLTATPAHAHGNGNLGDFYAGLFQPFFHPEFGFGALVFALWSAQQTTRSAFAIGAGFAGGVACGSLAAMFGAAPVAAAWGPRLAMMVGGPLVAARVPVPTILAAALAVAAGMAHGNAATTSELTQLTRPFVWTLGLGAGAGLLGAYANALVDRFPAFWMQVGVRVVGSWIAAIGLLVTAMALRAQ